MIIVLQEAAIIIVVVVAMAVEVVKIYIDDAFADTSAIDLTSSIKITKSTVSYLLTVSELLAYRLPDSNSTERIE